MSKVELARRCLGRIADVARRGESSSDPGFVGYSLQELSQVLLERTGAEDRVFEPISADEIDGLEKLHEELDIVDALSQDMGTRST